MEKDNEVKGTGNSYTTDFRQYDPRLGKWLSIDPLFANFPWQSPYVAFDNDPILLNDPQGLAAGGPDDKKSKAGSEGEDNTLYREGLLNEATVTASDPNNPANWSSEADRYGYSGTREQWIKEFGNPGGYTPEDEAAFNGYVEWADETERDRVNLHKLQVFTGPFKAIEDLNYVLPGAPVVGIAGKGLTSARAFRMVETLNASQASNVVEEIAVHGNSLNSMRPTWGYKLYSQDGAFLKNGITSNISPESRYTRAFMSDKYMVPVKQFPNRRAAWDWEFKQNQIQRGPLNKNMH